MNVFLSEIQEKEIISINDGNNYGHIIDVELDEKGNIISFIAQNKKIFSKLKKDEITFSYSDIAKIGKDVILVNI